MHKCRVEITDQEVIEHLGMINERLSFMSCLCSKVTKDESSTARKYVFIFEVSEKNKNRFESQLKKLNELLQRKSYENA